MRRFDRTDRGRWPRSSRFRLGGARRRRRRGFHRGPSPGGGAEHVVFVQTDNTSGNQVVAYDRARRRPPHPRRTRTTPAVGGVLNGSVVDHLASQGSLTYDQAHGLLYAVNAGSNTVSVFSVHGDQLRLRQVVESGGIFPGQRGRARRSGLRAQRRGWRKRLRGTGCRAAAPSRSRVDPVPRPHDPDRHDQFTHTPGQVVFSPDGSQLVVTTKANGNDIDVFGVEPIGRLSRHRWSTPSPAPYPSGSPSTAGAPRGRRGRHQRAGDIHASTRTGRRPSSTPLATGQAATCWVLRAGRSSSPPTPAANSVSGYQVSAGGQLTLLGATATDPGTVDASASADGRFLYVQTGGTGSSTSSGVNADGTLTDLGSVTVAGAAGGEGIVAL